MLLIPLWWILGALIGAAASQKRGFSMIGGIVGGVLLGPLAFLLYFVTPSKGDALKKCFFCAEWVKPEAQVCKHCHKDISPRALYEARKAVRS
jgi:hypothetical protein